MGTPAIIKMGQGLGKKLILIHACGSRCESWMAEGDTKTGFLS